MKIFEITLIIRYLFIIFSLLPQEKIMQIRYSVHALNGIYGQGYTHIAKSKIILQIIVI